MVQRTIVEDEHSKWCVNKLTGEGRVLREECPYRCDKDRIVFTASEDMVEDGSNELQPHATS